MRSTTMIAKTLGAAVVVVAPLMLAAPAQADRLTWRDATGDMTAAQGGTESPAPGHRVGDISKVKINHTARSVILRIDFVELRPVGQGLPFEGSIRSRPLAQNRPMHTFVWNAGSVEHGYDGWGDSEEIDPSAISGGLDYEGNMAGYHVTMDYAHRRIIVRIDRAQLDNPRWVKVTLNNVHVTTTGSWVADHAGTDTNTWDVWSPRVYTD